MKRDDVIALVIVFIIGLSIGWSLHQPKTIYISQQKTICEAKGGQYSFRPKWIGDGYTESCAIPQKEIEL